MQLTHSPAGAGRRGFTLVEMIVALVLFALIGGAIVKSLSTGQRAYDAQVQHIDMQQNLRLAGGFFPGELRELNASDGDIQAMDSVSLRVRSMRQMGFVCTLPLLGGALTGVNVLAGVTFAVRDSLQSSIRYFAPGDSVLIYYEGNPTNRMDDSWTMDSLTAISAGALVNCTDGSGKQGRLFTANISFQTLSPPQQPQRDSAGNITVGSPIRAFTSVTYKRLKVGSEWYVGFDSAGVASTAQPLIGPLADSLGLKFTYYDSLNNRINPPFTAATTRAGVARISIALALKTAAPVRKNVGIPAPDTSRVTLEVALRNNRRF